MQFILACSLFLSPSMPWQHNLRLAGHLMTRTPVARLVGPVGTQALWVRVWVTEWRVIPSNRSRGCESSTCMMLCPHLLSNQSLWQRERGAQFCSPVAVAAYLDVFGTPPSASLGIESVTRQAATGLEGAVLADGAFRWQMGPRLPHLLKACCWCLAMAYTQDTLIDLTLLQLACAFSYHSRTDSAA